MWERFVVLKNLHLKQFLNRLTSLERFEIVLYVSSHQHFWPSDIWKFQMGVIVTVVFMRSLWCCIGDAVLFGIIYHQNNLFLGEGWPCVIFERRPGLGSAKSHHRTRLQTLARICSRVSAELWCDNHSIILNPTWFYYDR